MKNNPKTIGILLQLKSGINLSDKQLEFVVKHYNELNDDQKSIIKEPYEILVKNVVIRVIGILVKVQAGEQVSEEERVFALQHYHALPPNQKGKLADAYMTLFNDQGIDNDDGLLR